MTPRLRAEQPSQLLLRLPAAPLSSHPCAAVVKFGSDAEAVAIANDCPFGLGSNVFSGSSRRARAIAAQLEVGESVLLSGHCEHLWLPARLPLLGLLWLVKLQPRAATMSLALVPTLPLLLPPLPLVPAGGHEQHQRLRHHLHVPEPALWGRQAQRL